MTQLQEHNIHTPIPILEDMRIELLRDCSLLCAHCSAYAAPHHMLQLPLQRVLSLVDEFASMSGCRVTLTGGEPLMYSGIEKILQRCSERRLHTRLFSSGIVFDNSKRVAGHKMLKKCAPFLDIVMYSVYSINAESHDRITRIPGSLQLTLEAIKHTVALGIEAEIHFVPTQINYRELPDVVALAASLNITQVGILRFVPHGRGKSRSDTLTLNREEHLWLRNIILALHKSYPHITLHVGSAYNLLKAGTHHPCTAGISQIVIEANGNIVPCSAFSNIHVKDKLGNILRQPLQTVWEQSVYLQQVRETLTDTHSCSGCLAQKAILAGRIDSQIHDPLERLVH